MRLSSPPIRFLTLTETLTGFRKPTRTISVTASLMLALNNPVRLCFGNRLNIFCKSSLKPKSRSLSASSNTSTSKDDWEQCTCDDEMSCSNRPGVEIRRFGECLRNQLRSWAGVIFPPSNNWGSILLDGDFDKTVVTSWLSASSPTDFKIAADGEWNSSNEMSTSYICRASSLLSWLVQMSW